MAEQFVISNYIFINCTMFHNIRTPLLVCNNFLLSPTISTRCLLA